VAFGRSPKFWILNFEFWIEVTLRELFYYLGSESRGEKRILSADYSDFRGLRFRRNQMGSWGIGGWIEVALVGPG